jgi:hypothetical protein
MSLSGIVNRTVKSGASSLTVRSSLASQSSNHGRPAVTLASEELEVLLPKERLNKLNKCRLRLSGNNPGGCCFSLRAPSVHGIDRYGGKSSLPLGRHALLEV